MTSEGTESTRTLEFLAWLEVNKTAVGLGLVALLVLGSAAATVRWVGLEKQRRASAALLELQLRAAADPEGIEASASEFQSLASQHSGTHAAARALLLAAGSLFRDGNFEEARQTFQQAEGLLEDDALRAGAAYGVAAALDALGRTDEAQRAYREVILQHPTAAVAGQARLALAGLQEQRGELEQALRSYSELTNVIGSPWADQARDRHQELLLRHPQLAPPAPKPAEQALPEPAAAEPAPPPTSSTNLPAAE